MSRFVVACLAVTFAGFISSGRSGAFPASAFPDGDTLELVGRIEPKETVEIRARVTGILAKVHFKEGEQVKKGQLLFELDAEPFQAALRLAEAEHLLLTARKKLGEEQLAILQPLVEKGTASKEELGKVKNELADVLARLKAAEEKLTAARQRLEFTKIHSPIAGRAGLSRLSPGNLVKADGPADALLTIVSQDPMHVYVEIDERTALRILRRAKDDKVAGLEAAVRLADEKEFSRKGQIDFFDNKINPKTGTLRVRATLPNPDGLLLPGLSVRVRLQLPAEK